MNGLFTDTIPLIFVQLEFYEQRNLARVCKLFYNYYCHYKKKEEFKEGIILRRGYYEKVIFDGISFSRLMKKAKRAESDTNEPIGSININLSNTGKITSTLYFPEHWRLLMRNRKEVESKILEGKSIIQMDKYNKLKTIKCPNVSKFTGNLIYEEFYGYNILKELSFSYESTNYCSLQQHMNELVSLHKFFLEGENTIGELFEEWMIDAYDRAHDDNLCHSTDEISYELYDVVHNCDQCENNWMIDVNYNVDGSMFNLRLN